MKENKKNIGNEKLKKAPRIRLEQEIQKEILAFINKK